MLVFNSNSFDISDRFLQNNVGIVNEIIIPLAGKSVIPRLPSAISFPILALGAVSRYDEQPL